MAIKQLSYKEFIRFARSVGIKITRIGKKSVYVDMLDNQKIPPPVVRNNNPSPVNPSWPYKPVSLVDLNWKEADSKLNFNWRTSDGFISLSEAILTNNRVAAIKIVRDRFSSTLLTTKQYVDARMAIWKSTLLRAGR